MAKLVVHPHPIPPSQRVIPFGLAPGCCAIAAALIDGHPMALTAERDGAIRQWDAATGELVRDFLSEQASFNEVLTMELLGQPAVVAVGLHGVRCWTADGRGVAVRAGSVERQLTSAHVTRDRRGGQNLLLGDYRGGVECWSEANELVWRLPLGVSGDVPLWALGGAAIRGTETAVVCIEGMVRTIDIGDGRVLVDAPVPGGDCLGLATFSRGPATLAALAVDTDVIVVDLATGAIAQRWSVGASPLSRICVLPSVLGVLLATVVADGTVGIWRTNGQEVGMGRLPAKGTAIAPVGPDLLVAGYEGGWADLYLVAGGDAQ